MWTLNGADGISDVEGKATRVGASERGQQTSFMARLYERWQHSQFSEAKR